METTNSNQQSDKRASANPDQTGKETAFENPNVDPGFETNKNILDGPENEHDIDIDAAAHLKNKKADQQNDAMNYKNDRENGAYNPKNI